MDLPILSREKQNRGLLNSEGDTMTRNPIADKQKPMSLIEIHEADPDVCGLSQEELDDRFEQEEERLNEVLLSYLPELHRRLKLSHGDALQQWIDTSEFHPVHLQAEAQDFDELVERIRRAVADYDLLYLNLSGWDGFCPFTIVTEAVQEEIKAFIGRLLKQNVKEMVKEIIDEILGSQDQDSFRIPGKTRFGSLKEVEDAAFFIYGIMEEQQVAQELQALWILNTSGERFSYMFLLESYPLIGNSKAWNHCRDILPAEIIEILDSQYGNGNKGADDEDQ